MSSHEDNNFHGNPTEAQRVDSISVEAMRPEWQGKILLSYYEFIYKNKQYGR